MTRDNAADSELPAHLKKMAWDLAGVLAEMPPIQLTRSLCKSADGLKPDEAFWAIDGIPHEWGTGVLDHPAMRYEIVELALNQDGSFQLFYQYSSLVDCQSQWAPQTMYSEDDWSDWWPAGSCAVTSAAAFELHGWFTTTQKAMDVARVLEQHELDDKSIVQARAALLRTIKLDVEAIASRRLEMLQKHQLDDGSVAQERATALINGGLDDENVQHLRVKLLEGRRLDDAAIEARRLKVYDETELDDSFLRFQIAQILENEELDNKGVKQRRAELLAQHGLA